MESTVETLQEHVITQRIRCELERVGVRYEELEHPPAVTCEEAAAHRGFPIRFGGKSILFYDKKAYSLFTLAADRKVDNKRIRKILGSSWLRFAREDELLTEALVPRGALPPFGNGIVFDFPHFLDRSIVDNEWIAFNAGTLTLSFMLRVEDYLKVAAPKICDFSIPVLGGGKH